MEEQEDWEEVSVERVLSRALPSTTSLTLALPSPRAGPREKDRSALLPEGRGAGRRGECCPHPPAGLGPNSWAILLIPIHVTE